jgi:cell division septum initiation protein DivIVA
MMALGTRRKNVAEASGEVPATAPEATAPAVADAATAVPAAPVPPAPLKLGAVLPQLPATLAPPAPPADPGVPAVAHSPEDEVAELRSAVGDLQALVASLVERAAPAGGDTHDASGTASRIIVAANEAAELAIASARAEADEMLTTAKAKSFEIIGVARELADNELEAERRRVASASEQWSLQRSQITERLVALESSLAAYRADLAAASETIQAAIGVLGAATDTDTDTEAAPADSTDAGHDVVVTDAESIDGDPAITATIEDAGSDPVLPEAPETVSPLAKTVVSLPQRGDGSKRSNLFGGSAPQMAVGDGAPVDPVLRSSNFGR